MKKRKAAAGLAIFTVLFIFIYFAQLHLDKKYTNPYIMKTERLVSEMESESFSGTWHNREPLWTESFEPREYVKVLSR